MTGKWNDQERTVVEEIVRVTEGENVRWRVRPGEFEGFERSGRVVVVGVEGGNLFMSERADDDLSLGETREIVRAVIPVVMRNDDELDIFLLDSNLVQDFVDVFSSFRFKHFFDRFQLVFLDVILVVFAQSEIEEDEGV